MRFASMPPCPVCQGTSFSPFARMGAYTYGRCRTCRLLALDPIPDPDAIDRHYRSKFDTGNYQTLLAFSDQYRRIYVDYVRWMARHCALAGLRSLDIGAFTGGLVSALLDAGADAYGVELQAKAVAIARERVPGRIHQVNVDEASSPFADDLLDLVTMMAVIEHVQLPVALLARVRRLLKPGGWLFLETPNASSWPAVVARRYWPLLAPVEHLYLFSAPAIRRALVQSGFDVVEIRPHVKWLSVAYVSDMMKNYGPEWRPLLAPLAWILPQRAREHWLLPFFSGEMLVAARAR